MSHRQDGIVVVEKHGSIEHVDIANSKVDTAVQEAAARGQVISGYETLTPWETVKTFKIATAVCFGMAFSAATDGYQIA